MSINWAIEWPEIEKVAADYFVDPLFIAAIRRAENGAAGREFGVLSEPADGYDGQLRACCGTVRRKVRVYIGNPFTTIQGPSVQRCVYSRAFVEWFAYGDKKTGGVESGWCPEGAENDPKNLNANWPKNVAAGYYGWAALGRVQ
jgi:hypothetical protein